MARDRWRPMDWHGSSMPGTATTTTRSGSKPKASAIDGEEEGRCRADVGPDHLAVVEPSDRRAARLRHGTVAHLARLSAVQGFAPYCFEIDAAIYIGEQGRTAARFSGEYDMLITQRLILQPELELRLYGKDDPENGIGSGLSERRSRRYGCATRSVASSRLMSDCTGSASSGDSRPCATRGSRRR